MDLSGLSRSQTQSSRFCDLEQEPTFEETHFVIYIVLLVIPITVSPP